MSGASNRASGSAVSGPRRRFRIKRSLTSAALVVFIDPVPGAGEAGEELFFEYISNAWCQDAASTAQTDWAADSDTGIIAEEILELETTWRAAKSFGQAYQEYMRDAQVAIEHELGAEGGAPVLNLNPQSFPMVGENMPEAGFG